VQALFFILLAVICVLSSCFHCKLVSPVILGFLIKAGPKMAFYLNVMFGRKYTRRRRVRDVRRAVERAEQLARATQGDGAGAGSTGG
jgi:hypothetical protein